MIRPFLHLARLMRDRKGATAIEYGLILALVVLALMMALIGLGSQNRSSWDSIETKVREASKT